MQHYPKLFRILKLQQSIRLYLNLLLVTLLAEPLQARKSGCTGAQDIVRVGDVVPERAVGFGSSGAERFLTLPTGVSLFAQFVARRDGVAHAGCTETGDHCSGQRRGVGMELGST
jgi:hypothetical protein